VIAIAAGIVDALELGTNARAALITRGLAETTRLGVRWVRRRDLRGTGGMGDLILTCTGDSLATGHWGSGWRRIVAHRGPGSSRRAEGVNACRSVVRLAERFGVEMPICRRSTGCSSRAGAREAVVRLMTRDLRFEGLTDPGFLCALCELCVNV